MKIFPIGAGQSADTGSVTARKTDVRKGKTAYVNGYDEPVAGEMPEFSGINANGKSSEYGNQIKVSPSADGYYSTTSGLLIPKNTVANTGGLTENKLAYGETAFDLVGKYKGKGNAVQNQVLSGATFSTSNLSNAVGTIPIVSGRTITPSNVNQVAMYPNQYASSQTTVLGDPNLKPENIVKNITIFNTRGTAEVLPAGDIYDLYNKGVTSPLIGGWNFYYFDKYNSDALVTFYPTYIDMYVNCGSSGQGYATVESLNRLDPEILSKFEYTNLEFTITEALGNTTSTEFGNFSYADLGYHHSSGGSYYSEFDASKQINKNYLNYTLIIKLPKPKFDNTRKYYLKFTNDCYTGPDKTWKMRFSVKRIWLSQM